MEVLDKDELWDLEVVGVVEIERVVDTGFYDDGELFFVFVKSGLDVWSDLSSDAFLMVPPDMLRL